MAKELPNYFKTFRKLYGLTQKELSFLLGFEGGEHISRLECRQKEPSLRTVLAYQILFATKPEKLIPGVWKEVENVVLTRLKIFATSGDVKPTKRVLVSKLAAFPKLDLKSGNKPKQHDTQ